jgi:uncharacterized membrane protein HdeD (DUF308 family)
MLLVAIARKWWVLLLNGLCAILFGVMAFAWPQVTLLALVILYGVYCLADGITALGASLARREEGRPWGRMLLIGIVSIAAGVVTFLWPGITAIALLVIIAVWAIIHGITEIIAAIELRKFIHNEWLLILAGVVSVLFGVVMIARPGVGALSLIWVIGTFAILHGLLLVALAFKLRGLAHAVPPAAV